MTFYEVLQRHGIKTGIITVAIVVIVVIVAVTCLTRKPGKDSNVSTNSSTVTTNKAGVTTPKTNPESTDKISGSSKLFKGYKYVGNSQSKVYHVADGSCPVADKIKPNHIEKFDTKEQARRHGYERCEICKP